jgi:aldehyde dehydrogenase (NAD+)
MSGNAASEMTRDRFFIGGKWVKPVGTDTVEVRTASTGDVMGTAALASVADLDLAVRAARSALDDGPWGRTSPAERAEAMTRFADALAVRAESTSNLVSRENGMPIGTSTIVNGINPAKELRFLADLIRNRPAEEIRESANGRTIVRREPVGVVGAITPWNFPQSLAMNKIAPALAAGCTVVLKHSPETALDSYVLADAAQEAGLPPGVLNIVLGGRELGAALVSHPQVDKISFTGSTEAGRKIGAECGRLVRGCTLELGGKSAAIVLDDADLDTLSTGLGRASFLNNSQTCTTQSRILAPRSRYAEVVDAVSQRVRSMVVGDPLDPKVEIGPMVSEQHRNRVLGYIDIARRSDARLITGGGKPTGFDRGWFVEPTVFADVDNSDQLAREEVFGPVMAIIPYDGGEEEAIRIANDSDYGLAGSVWTADENRGLEVARRVRTGTIGVNYYSSDPFAPFGGVKASGIGRERGPEGLEHYVEYKSIYAGPLR